MTKTTSQILLGVNIDHVATLRQARGTRYPDPVYAAQIAEHAGADSITFHLREDRRHIQERDCLLLKETVQTKLNLEMAVTDSMLDFAIELQPQDCCLVPEKREELTTEGGLDVAGQLPKMKQACQRLADRHIRVSPFIDADKRQIDAVLECGAPCIEIHTGHFADAAEDEQNRLLAEIFDCVEYAHSQGLQVNAGHGLHYHNVQKIAINPLITELNIGHSIVANALFQGFANAVSTMKQLMIDVRS